MLAALSELEQRIQRSGGSGRTPGSAHSHSTSAGIARPLPARSAAKHATSRERNPRARLATAL